MRLNFTPRSLKLALGRCAGDLRSAICDFPPRSLKLALGRRAGVHFAGTGLTDFVAALPATG